MNYQTRGLYLSLAIISDRPQFASGKNLDLKQSTGFGSGNTCNLGFGKKFGTKINQKLKILKMFSSKIFEFTYYFCE